MSKCTILSFTAGLLLAAGAGIGQTTAPLSFEVASVKPSALDMTKLAQQMQSTGEMPKMGPHVTAARAEYIFMDLKSLIAEAYKVKQTQINGPDWLNSVLSVQRWDIFAKMPDGATPEQSHEMLQTLLAERFKLTVHRDNKEHAVLALVVAKGGPKLQESPEGQDFDDNTPLKPGESEMQSFEGKIRVTVDMKNGGSVMNMGKRGTWTQSFNRETGSIKYVGTGVTMSGFADMLSSMTQVTGGSGLQVVDMSGLKGTYFVSLELSMADLMKMVQAMGLADASNAPAGRPAEAASDPGNTDMAQAAVQKFGLKLESRKAPAERLVIDHVEKTPTEN